MFQFIDARSGLLSDLLTRVTDIGRNLDSVKKQQEKPLIEQCENLLDKEGEATALAQAQQVLSRYSELDKEERKVFFLEVLEKFGTDKPELEQAIKNWQKNKNEANARTLHFASEPRSQNLLRKMNQAPNGTLALVKMRSNLLSYVRTHPELKSLDADFAHLFASWFNRGFLKLRTMDWSTPANILEKVIAYEAVHEISTWSDLRQRVVDKDRLLYSYFHPALGIEPLIFVQVALTDHIPSAIAPILKKKRKPLDPASATTAVFYSISNCQKGLRGISFGNFLIKQVVENLNQEFPNLKTFVTLSPVTGFRAWALNQHKHPDPITTEKDLIFIAQLEKAKDENTLPKLINDHTDIRKLLAKYLVSTRSPRGGASDAVSRFHLGNGAQLENIHAMADMSENGLDNSWGCMVNYQYRKSDIEKNHETYVNGDKIITSSAVQSLLK